MSPRISRFSVSGKADTQIASLLRRELLYSSQAPSVSLQHDLDANSFEPFHSMGETISSRLRQLLVKQMERYEDADEDVNMDEETKTKLGESSFAHRIKSDFILFAYDVVELQTDLRSSQLSSEPCAVSRPCHIHLILHIITDPQRRTDINRIHPVDSQGVQNIQSSTTGHYVLDEHETKARARIMVINNSHDRGNGGYVGLMNAVFAAQKRVGRRARSGKRD